MYGRYPGNPGGYQSSQNGSYNNGQQTGSQQPGGYSSSSSVNYPQSGYASSSVNVPQAGYGSPVNFQQTGCASNNGMFSPHYHDHHHGHHHGHHSIIEEILDPHHHHHHHHHCK